MSRFLFNKDGLLKILDNLQVFPTFLPNVLVGLILLFNDHFLSFINLFECLSLVQFISLSFEFNLAL
jgi:hypothetical protein